MFARADQGSAGWGMPRWQPWLGSSTAFPGWPRAWGSTELWGQSIPTWELTFLCQATSLAHKWVRAGAPGGNSPLPRAGTSDALGITILDPNSHSPGTTPACSPSAASCSVNAKLPSYRHVLRLN